MTIQEILQEYRVPHIEQGHHHCTPRFVQVDCPFCSPGTQRWRLGISKVGLFTNCWSCGPHKLYDVLLELLNIPRDRVVLLLKGLDPGWVKDDREVKGQLRIPTGVGDLLPVHRRYLGSRGFNADELKQLWGIKGIGLATRLAWRIFIPITLNHKVVSWSTRSVSEDTVRYVTARKEEEAYPFRKLLYGEEYCRNSIIVHEGPFDVWRTGPGATCIWGLEWTRAQVLRMSKYPVRVICFDNEPEAQRRAKQLCSELEVMDGSTFNVVLSGKDAASSPLREIQELRRRFLS